jgi:hypothetical protein
MAVACPCQRAGPCICVHLLPWLRLLPLPLLLRPRRLPCMGCVAVQAKCARVQLLTRVLCSFASCALLRSPCCPTDPSAHMRSEASAVHSSRLPSTGWAINSCPPGGTNTVRPTLLRHRSLRLLAGAAHTSLGRSPEPFCSQRPVQLVLLRPLGDVKLGGGGVVRVRGRQRLGGGASKGNRSRWA